MADSNGAWGDLAAHDQALASLWDSFSPLPEPGENASLDALCKRKNISIGSLVKQGAKMSDDTTIAFPYNSGVKYRDLVTNRRWNNYGSEFTHLKIVRASLEPTERVLVCESETDAARLTDLYNLDVAIMPAGAKFFPESFADTLRDYRVVLIALDNDEAGDVGTEKIREVLANTAMFRPPEQYEDWAEVPDDVASTIELPAEPEFTPSKVIVPAGEMMEIETPEIVSWFEDAILPVSGLMLLHGWAKSYKTFIGLDLMACLAQGLPWATFGSMEEPCRTLVMQYEIPWAFYKQRIELIREGAEDREAFDTNFHTWEPTKRPSFKAGSKKHEDFVINSMVDSGIQVLFLDPIRRATGAIDMNSEKDVRPVLEFFERVQNEGITVVTTHHDNKDAGRRGGGEIYDMTGSGAFSGDPDTLVSVELPYGEDHRTSPRRNLNFTLRNAETPQPRAFEMTDTGFNYYEESWVGGNDDEFDASAPSI